MAQRASPPVQRASIPHGHDSARMGQHSPPQGRSSPPQGRNSPPRGARRRLSPLSDLFSEFSGNIRENQQVILQGRSRTHSGDDYKDEEVFDHKAYLERYWSLQPASRHTIPLAKDVLRDLHDIFHRKVTPRGKKQLDFGSGLCMHAIYSSCRLLSEVTCAEFSPVLRKQLQVYLSGKEPDYDPTHLIKYTAKLEKRQVYVVEQRIKSAVKRVIPCNALEKHVLGENLSKERFDCITSSFCLEAACPDVNSYFSVIRKLYSLLIPGGVFVLVGIFDQDWYDVNGARFYTLNLEQRQVEKAILEAGFTPPTWSIHTVQRPNDLNNASAYYTMFAHRPNEKEQ